MKKNYLFLLSIFLFVFIQHTATAQVGIGTTVPTAKLDVDGDLRVRDLPTLTESEVLTTDVNGNIGKFRTFLISDAGGEVASTNVDRVLTSAQTVNDTNLNLSTTVTIPANKEAIIIINYSVPVGLASFTQPEGYYGIRFLKNGAELQQGSRKYSINNNSATRMVSVANVVIDKVAATGVDQTITYTLNGYLEQLDAGTHTYRFNMWSGLGSNYNWGYGSISKIVYLK